MGTGRIESESRKIRSRSGINHSGSTTLQVSWHLFLFFTFSFFSRATPPQPTAWTPTVPRPRSRLTRPPGCPCPTAPRWTAYRPAPACPRRRTYWAMASPTVYYRRHSPTVYRRPMAWCRRHCPASPWIRWAMVDWATLWPAFLAVDWAAAQAMACPALTAAARAMVIIESDRKYLFVKLICIFYCRNTK